MKNNNKKIISSAKTKINHMNRNAEDEECDEWDYLYDDAYNERREERNRRAERKQLKYSSDNS